MNIGDTVIRKAHKNHDRPITGTITAIRGRRADVRWHGANRNRLGATSPDKRGSILISALMMADGTVPVVVAPQPKVAEWQVQHQNDFGLEMRWYDVTEHEMRGDMYAHGVLADVAIDQMRRFPEIVHPETYRRTYRRNPEFTA